MTRSTTERDRRAGFSLAPRGTSQNASLPGSTCGVPGKPAQGHAPIPGGKGFTLIEVLVALAIVTIGMAAVLEALTSSASAALYLRDKTFAEWTALNQVEQTRLHARLTGQIPSTGVSTGHIRNAGRRWHWRQKVIKTLVPGVERIVVDIRPASGHGKEWYATVTGYVGNKIAPPNPAVPSWGQSATGVPSKGQPSNTPSSSTTTSSSGHSSGPSSTP